MDKLNNAQERILSEDTLKHIYHCQQEDHHPTIQSVAGALQTDLDRVADLLAKMAYHDLVQIKNGTIHLTIEGEAYALQIIRAHRLWERYLADETGYEEHEWHERADRQEHHLSPSDLDALAAKLGQPSYDPHGDPIPTAAGEVVSQSGYPLSSMTPGQRGQIIHLEDEPRIVYEQLVAEGLYVGMQIQLKERTNQRICFISERGDHVLAPIVAANLSVQPLRSEQASEGPAVRLSDLALGAQGRVLNISPACYGAERRRLMDLGLLPGTLVTAELKSPGGDPNAYRIRGALIALRHEQADLINITPVGRVRDGYL